jgi:glycosyltransferase involved in cell wall biosynthesis
MRIIAVSALPLWVMGEGKGLPSVYYGVKRLVDAGHEVHFVTPKLHLWNRDLDAEYRKKPNDETYNGIHIHRFGIPWIPSLRSAGLVKEPMGPARRYANRFVSFFALAALWIFFTVSAVRRSARIARAGRPDAVVAHNGIAAAAGFILAKRYGAPLVTKIYGTFLSQIPWRPLHLLLHFPEVLGFKIPCDCLIVDNDGTQGDRIAERLGVPPSRLRFLMNGVDKDMYDPGLTPAEARRTLRIPPEMDVAMTLGRLSVWKGVDKLIRALPSIVAEHPSFLVLVVGDGEERGALAALARELGVENHVRFEGSVRHEDVKTYLHAVDLFVSTQDVTNFGVHMMEAMICGKCVVTLDNADTGRYLENGVTGVLLEPDRTDLLPSTILGLLRDGDRRNRMGRNARLHAERHFQTWNERMDVENGIIGDLVERRRSGGAAGTGAGAR